MATSSLSFYTLVFDRCIMNGMLARITFKISNWRAIRVHYLPFVVFLISTMFWAWLIPGRNAQATHMRNLFAMSPPRHVHWLDFNQEETCFSLVEAKNPSRA